MKEIIYNLRIGTSKGIIKFVKSLAIYKAIYYFKTERKINKYNIERNSFFSELEIETVNRCNGSCSFCPVNINEKQRPYAKMTDDLFMKIINELSEKGYQGNICIYSNNEPFLDERISEFYKIARKKLPEAYLYIYTNGTLLTLDLFKNMIDNMDKMIIDNYSDTHELRDNLKPIYEYCRDNHLLRKKVIFSMRKQSEVLSSRGGQSPNKKKIRNIKSKCYLPFKQAIIRPDGKLSLCCNDALGVYTMGDVNFATLTEIWNAQSYNEIRQKMKNGGRKAIKLCDRCDTRG